MKTILFLIVTILAMLLTAEQAQAQLYVYKAKRVYTYTDRTDTSATLSTKFMPYIEVGYTTAGTDSMKIIVQVDYLLGSVWRLGAARDTLLFGKATNPTIKARSFVLIAPYAATPMPGATSFRIRNTVTGYASGDSTGAGSYTQWLIYRKND